jgi:serine/threonine protein kinase
LIVALDWRNIAAAALAAAPLVTESASPIPKRHALVVGIDNYPTQPLRVCTHDAREMAAAIALPEYGFAASMLLNEECTRKNLRQRLESLFRTPAESYLFYFSGHGWATDVGVYLVTVDSDVGEEGVDLEYLRRLILKLAPESSTVVVILDCCHAGTAAPRGLSATGVNIRSHDVGQSIPALPLGRVVLAACRGDQLAYEDSKLGHGVFTSEILQGLMGDAADSEGMVTVTGLYDYASRAFAESGLQTPVFRGDIAGRLVLGSGFIPRSAPVLNEERAIEIEREAERHLQDYQVKTSANYGNLNHWKAEGHKTACQMMEPVLNWFEKQAQIPGLQRRSRFASSNNAALQRLATLCVVEAGTVTPYGTIRERLGSGTFGTVWKLQDAPTDSPLAYKGYHAQDLPIPEKIRRFNRGYSAMSQMDHPQIVKVHRLTKCPLGFYMDFIDGPNLRNFSGTLDDPQSNVRILLTIADTLRHAHARGVVHRDVKPENIVMRYSEETGEWLPFLTDFDLAWFSTASQVFTKDGMGSIYYASPEQYATPSAASAHAATTDIYSFGQLLFFVATGSDPVPLGVADNMRALKNRLGSGWFADAAETFLGLYENCTQPKPEKRPQDFGEICDRLFRISQSLTAVSGSKGLPAAEFLREVVFSVVGLASQSRTQGVFLTASRKLRVSLEVRRDEGRYADLRIDVTAQDDPVVKTYDQVRKILFGRVESAVANYPNSRIKHGSGGRFQVFVEFDRVPMDLDGVATARARITRVIDLVEGR